MLSSLGGWVQSIIHFRYFFANWESIALPVHLAVILEKYKQVRGEKWVSPRPPWKLLAQYCHHWCINLCHNGLSSLYSCINAHSELVNYSRVHYWFCNPRSLLQLLHNASIHITHFVKLESNRSRQFKKSEYSKGEMGQERNVASNKRLKSFTIVPALVIFPL